MVGWQVLPPATQAERVIPVRAAQEPAALEPAVLEPEALDLRAALVPEALDLRAALVPEALGAPREVEDEPNWSFIVGDSN
jgi:hypothetical protein